MVDKIGRVGAFLGLAVVLLLAVRTASAQNLRVGAGAQGTVNIFNNQVCSELTPNSGIAYCTGGALAVLPAQTAITTVTTIQAMNSTGITIKAATLNAVGKTLHVHGYFVFSNASTTPT